MIWIDGLVSVGVGLGLAAAAGLRVFVPLLVLSLGARLGYVEIAPDFAWIATTPALVAFAVATGVEVGAYYVPWVDNLLDTIATPAAALAGILVTASVTTDLPPLLKWAVALVGGGGAAGLVAGTTSLARLKSSVTTAGLANPVLATIELVASAVTALLALVVPLVVFLGLALLVFVAWRLSRRGRPAPATRG